MGSVQKDHRKDAIVVLGMHRSGTSAISRVLSLAGAQLPKSLMVPGPGNPDGHWEPQDVAEFNDRIFDAIDSSWSDTFGPRGMLNRGVPTEKYRAEAREVIRDNYGDGRFIVMKEPRSSLFIDLWRNALTDEGYNVAFVIAVRHPLEVAASLKSRDGFVDNKSILLWTSYMLSCEMATRGSNRVFVKFDDLLDDPEGVLNRIESRLGLQFPRRSWDSALEIQEFLKAENKHHSVSASKRNLKKLDKVDSFYAYLDAASRDESWNADMAQEAADWLSGLEETLGPILKQVEREARKARAAEHSLWTQLVAVRQDLDAADSAAKAELAAREAELSAQLERAEADIQVVRQSVSDLEAALAASKLELTAQQDQFTAELARVALEAPATEARIADMEDALMAAKAERDEASADLEASKAELEAVRAEFESSKAEFDAVKAHLEAAKAEFSGAKTRFSEVKTVGAVREVKAVLRAERAEAEVRRIKRGNADLEALIETIKAEVNAQLDSSAAETKEALARVSDLDRALAEAGAREAGLVTRLEAMTSEARTALARVSGLDQALAEVQAAQAISAAREDEARRQLDEAAATIEHIQNRSSELSLALVEAISRPRPRTFSGTLLGLFAWTGRLRLRSAFR